MRIDPPVSLPRAAGTIPAATAAPEPPLEPPGMRCSSCGLRTGAEVRVVRGDPVSELVHVCFAYDDRSRGFQLIDRTVR